MRSCAWNGEGRSETRVSGRSCPSSHDRGSLDQTGTGWPWERSWQIESELTVEGGRGILRHPGGEIDTASTRTFFYGVVKLPFNG